MPSLLQAYHNSAFFSIGVLYFSALKMSAGQKNACRAQDSSFFFFFSFDIIVSKKVFGGFIHDTNEMVFLVYEEIP